MNPVTIKAEISADADLQEILIARLSDMGFTGFEQTPDYLYAYISARGFTDRVKRYLDELKHSFSDAMLTGIEEVADRNWNELWEASVEPQLIGSFYIRPTWAKADHPGKITIIVDPKMAFGTGYHATTRLMLEKLSVMEIEGKQVLDAGTGTGILAIAASKRGAKSVFAFDTDMWSKVNASENVRVNRVDDKIEIVAGNSGVIPVEAAYDAILANINRNTLIELLPVFVSHLNTGGVLCMSGLQIADREVVISTAEDCSLLLTDENRSGEWLMLCFRFAGESKLSE